MDDFYLIQELTIGDKQRRLTELSEKIKTLAPDDIENVAIMEETLRLSKEVIEFMTNYSNNDTIDEQED